MVKGCHSNMAMSGILTKPSSNNEEKLSRGKLGIFLVKAISGNQEGRIDSLNQTEKNALRVKPY